MKLTELLKRLGLGLAGASAVGAAALIEASKHGAEVTWSDVYLDPVMVLLMVGAFVAGAIGKH